MLIKYSLDEFELVKYKTKEDIFGNTKICEGKHFQQVVYSTYGDVLTQICFDCKKIRTTKD